MPKSVIIPAGTSTPIAPFVPGTLADGVVYVFSSGDAGERGIQRVAEIIDVTDPAKKGFDIEQGGFLGKIRPGLMGGILQYHPKILEEKAVAQGRLHAHVGGYARKDQMTNYRRPKGANPPRAGDDQNRDRNGGWDDGGRDLQQHLYHRLEKLRRD